MVDGVGMEGDGCGHLARVGAGAIVTLEDVGRAGGVAPVIVQVGSHGGGVTADRHADGELVAGLSVGRGELGQFVE